MLRLTTLALAAVLTAPPGASRETVVTLVALSDYHSHALPFRSEGRPGQGGIARAVAYIKKMRAAGPTLVLSGGDMLNEGVPAWSDEYRCVEWPWLSGLVDAMALGNHDLDYGAAIFEGCRRSASYPILASNLVSEDGTPFLQVRERPYVVAEAAGLRIGVFAVAGDDFARLVAKDHLPLGTRFVPALPAARKAVRDLRELEKVDATHAAFREAEGAVKARIQKLLAVNGTRSVDSFHRELGRIMWDHCGMARNEKGLKEALTLIPELRRRYWSEVKVLGTGEELNQSLEKAGRVADFLELGELLCRDALERRESCGGHFREEFQAPDGEAQRDDEHFAHVAAWEYTGDDQPPRRHVEPLHFENVHLAQRSYK